LRGVDLASIEGWAQNKLELHETARSLPRQSFKLGDELVHVTISSLTACRRENARSD